jgi:hypothetical protein
VALDTNSIQHRWPPSYGPPQARAVNAVALGEVYLDGADRLCDPVLAVCPFPTKRAGIGHRGKLTEMMPCVMPGMTFGTMSGMI